MIRKKTGYKFKLNAWYPSKKNGNPHFWALAILPEIQLHHPGKGEGLEFYISWLFWTFEISKEYI